MKKNTIYKIIALIAFIAVAISNPFWPTKSVQAGSNGQPGTQKIEAQATEENQKRLREKYPIPQLDQSQELENLKKRLDLVNNQNLVGYIYLLGQNGQVVANYTTKGKVSSLESYLTTPEQLVDRYGAPCGSNSSTSDCWTVESPDLDGSYGHNPAGVFFLHRYWCLR